MDYHRAIRFADAAVAALAPYCAQIEIAGSLRRGRPQVGDVDLVVQAHPGQEPGLRSRAKARAKTVSEGDFSLIVEAAGGIQVDIWFAQGERRDLLSVFPGTFGTILLCRTGSREFNIKVATRAKALGMHWDPARGLFRNGHERVASDTEEGLFKALGLRWIPPHYRETEIFFKQWELEAPAPVVVGPERGTRVSDADAERMFAALKARCLKAGTELEERLARETQQGPV
jgi:DNA polymerase (family X)